MNAKLQLLLIFEILLHISTRVTPCCGKNRKEIFRRWLRRVSLECIEGGCQLK